MNKTVKYYESNFKEYINKTKDVDMSDEYISFISNLKGENILDLGFASLRDSFYFRDIGFNVSCLDPVKSFCDIAIENNFTTYNSCIEETNFSNEFNGIWACASLIHVEEENINKAIYKCYKALKSNGIMYCSFKINKDKDERYFNNLSKEKLINLFQTNKFNIIEINESNDKLQRDNTWISFLMKK